MWNWFLAVLAILVFTVPWVVILAAPVVVLAACSVKLALWGSARLRDAVGGVSQVHHVGGLTDRKPLERAVRRAIGRTLRTAADSPAVGCACIKPADRGHVGVLRIQTGKGHYLRTIVGHSRAQVACRIINTCAAMSCAHGGPAMAVVTEDCVPERCPAGWPYGPTARMAMGPAFGAS